MNRSRPFRSMRSFRCVIAAGISWVKSPPRFHFMAGEAEVNLPPLQRDAAGRVDVDSVPDVIEWFLDYDQRVAVVRDPSVEEVFQWKQQQSQAQGEDVFIFKRAEDRLAIGIIQALGDNATERSLHAWIGQLLGALDT